MAVPEAHFGLEAAFYITKTVISGYRSDFAASAGEQLWDRKCMSNRSKVFCWLFFLSGGVLCKRLASGLATNAGVALPLEEMTSGRRYACRHPLVPIVPLLGRE